MGAVNVKVLSAEPSVYNYGEARPRGESPVGLGHFETKLCTLRSGERFWRWFYVTPRGLRVPMHAHGHTPENPPPLPQRAPRRCGCSKAVGGPAHTCGECGQPFFVEIHGVADGYCTYCYYQG